MFRGGRRSQEPKFFWLWLTRDPFNAGISLRLLVSTKKILGIRAGTFATRRRDYTPMSLIYIALLEIGGGETGIVLSEVLKSHIYNILDDM